MNLSRTPYRIAAILVVVCLVSIAAGCGTVFNGSRQNIAVTSTPEGASVFVNSQPYGETPLTINLKRSEMYVVRLELPGYEPQEVVLTRSTSPLFWLSIPTVIGVAIDVLSGSMYRLNPDEVIAQMENQQVSLAEDEDGIFVTLVLKPDPSWEKIGTLKPIAHEQAP